MAKYGDSMDAHIWRALLAPKPAVIADLAGTAACAWCGLGVALATFTAHTRQCERAKRSGQAGLFGDISGQQALFPVESLWEVA
jgi:hypothetical protein